MTRLLHSNIIYRWERGDWIFFQFRALLWCFRIPHLETISQASSLHFSDESENSFNSGFRMDSNISRKTAGERFFFLLNTSFLIFSRDLFLVLLFSSAKQLMSLWRLCRGKHNIPDFHADWPPTQELIRKDKYCSINPVISYQSIRHIEHIRRIRTEQTKANL